MERLERKRIRGIQQAIESGKADAEEPESLALETLEKLDPQALEELSPEEGLAVATRYERASTDHKRSTPRGEDTPVQAPTSALSQKADTSVQPQQAKQESWLRQDRKARPRKAKAKSQDNPELNEPSEENDAFEAIWKPREAELINTLSERLAGVTDRIGVPPVTPLPSVKAIYVGPYAMEDRVQALASKRKQEIQEQCGINLQLVVADPPFQVETELDSKGYWLNPVSYTHLTLPTTPYV